MSRLLTSAFTALLGTSLLACATQDVDDSEPGETIVDGAADSWGNPTKFGQMFQGTWLFGELDQSSNLKYPAWDFTLDGNATITIQPRQAPTDEVEVKRMAVYLYKQRSTGTYQRVTKAVPLGANGFPKLTRALEEGTYRVIVKSVAAESGKFMVRMDCTGAGCADGPQCLLGDTFAEGTDLKHGALVTHGDTRLTSAMGLSNARKAQIVAAAHESTYDDVTTAEEAFETVDSNEIYRYTMHDQLMGRQIIAFEYGAGDNSYGGVFVGENPVVVAGIHDGDIDGCTLVARTCVFGQQKGEAAFMPRMRKVGERTIKSPAGVSAILAKQIIKSVQYDEPLTLAQAIAATDDAEIYVEELAHDDGRRFVGLHYHSGDTPIGHFFTTNSETPAAEISDGEIEDCTATY